MRKPLPYVGQIPEHDNGSVLVDGFRDEVVSDGVENWFGHASSRFQAEEPLGCVDCIPRR